MQLGLAGRVALVTGASRGIGLAVARELAAEGADVLLVARDGEAMAGAAAEIAAATGRRAEVHAVDLCQPEAPAAAVAACERAFGRLDVLVNNAGATKRGDFFSLSEADWQDGFALKFFGYVRLTRAAWPLLRASDQAAVVNVIGIGGRTPGTEFTIGGSVNAGLLSFTKAMAEVGIEHGITVNAVNPGPIETDRLRGRIRSRAAADMVSEADAAKRLCAEMGVARFGRPEEVAALVTYLAGARARFLQGALIDLDGGLTKTI